MAEWPATSRELHAKTGLGLRQIQEVVAGLVDDRDAYIVGPSPIHAGKQGKRAKVYALKGDTRVKLEESEKDKYISFGVRLLYTQMEKLERLAKRNKTSNADMLRRIIDEA